MSTTQPADPTSRWDNPTPAASTHEAVMVATIVVAAVSTISSWLAMVGFAQHAVGMGSFTAHVTGGVFELALVTVALLAREAAQSGRPTRTLLTLTWAMSTCSGVFAGWHEVWSGHPAGAAAFRFAVPLLAALMWHLALVGDAHLATGRTWHDLRAQAAMRRLVLATEDMADTTSGTTRGGRWRTWRHARAWRRARAGVLSVLTPAQISAHTLAWGSALGNLACGTDRFAWLRTVRPTGPDHDRLGHRHTEPHTMTTTTASAPATPTTDATGGAPRRATPPARPTLAPTSATGATGGRAAAARAMRQGGASVTQIADHLGAHRRTVHRWLAQSTTSGQGGQGQEVAA
jgi:hypothetical protein